MPAGKIWTGTLSFVLVSIPVELVSAVRYNYISFRMMHKKDNAFLERRMFCPKHNKYVPYEHVINGYELEKDKYVIVREEEYESLEPKRSQSIEIEAFVDPEEIGSIYLDKPYYLLPRKGGESYEMLRQALYETNKAGIARVVFHEREHLVMVRANKDVIELITLHYIDQIRKPDEILPHKQAQAAQVKSITHQIEKTKGKYEPEKYIDDYKRQVLEYLEEKIKKGKTVTIEQPEEQAQESEEQTQGDLVTALEESLSRIKNK